MGSGSGFLKKVRSMDFYKKLPTDLVESSLLGGTLSIAASLFIAFLLVAEFRSYMRSDTESIMVVDRSPHGEMLRINFNISFPALSCEYATLDVSDALGSKKLNLTKTVRKAPIDAESLAKVGYGVEDFKRPEPKYDEFPDFGDVDPYGEMDFLVPLDEASWDAHMNHYDVVIVNFFAPWCHWCQQLAPTWEAVTQVVHQKYPEADGRVRMAKVDCVATPDLCQKHQITAYPSIRIFIHGTDDVVDQVGRHNHLAYYGDRTTEALTLVADQAADAHGKKPHMHGIQNANSINQKGSGCNFSGMLLVKKVPGTLHFSARAPGHTIDYLSMNMSHHVHHLYFGNKPTKKNRMLLESKFPQYFESGWLDKMAGQAFIAENPGATYEHYLQTVLTTVEPTSSPKLKAARSINVYEYTAQSHAYDAEDHASVKVTYKMSPIQVIVSEKLKPFYHFITSVCAIAGGVFTVAGLMDSVGYNTARALKKKVDLGKQG
eukprot:CAMPEP_0182612710 /NCGR_PEP_ID=MMETSP1330-20130603/20606_1 /TAXON_ID=464278 /ORGANISM="Picochlorum sp., Strain RCC944" /LENGTH=488 /DNA_ID=CAMNT_0024832301 /DNA_START=142 /DNA_END=1608 /DNA_ORIENTATION=+